MNDQKLIINPAMNSNDKRALDQISQILASPSMAEYWHRLTIIDGTRYKKEEILALVFKAVYPQKLIPYKYEKDGDDTFFLFRNGALVVKALLSRNLKLFNPYTETSILLRLELKYLPFQNDPVNTASITEKVILKRVNIEKKVVDLRNFLNDPDLKDIYIPLSELQCVSTVCDVIHRILPKPTTLLLSYNNLDKLEFLDYLRKISISVRCLDLSNNMISWSGFEKIPLTNIKELWLEGNPLYDDFMHSSAELLKEVKRIIPSLTKLDGVELGRTVPGEIVSLRTWFKNRAYAKFVDHFLHHYYILFESEREQLKKIYHPDASLSIAVDHIDSQSTTICQRINYYIKFSRNLISMSDMQKAVTAIYYGPEKIMEVLNDFPTVIFDQFSFQVDVPIINLGKNEMIQINICGVFKDLDCDTSAIFAFDRTVLLVPWKQNPGEWKITNDMWTITNATTTLVMSSFKFAKKPIQSDFGIMVSPKHRNKELLTRVVGELTHMNAAWVQKFLSETGWNLEFTLQAFTDQYKANQIPAEAFVPLKDSK